MMIGNLVVEASLEVQDAVAGVANQLRHERNETGADVIGACGGRGGPLKTEHYGGRRHTNNYRDSQDNLAIHTY